jgi:hypothetical protein
MEKAIQVKGKIRYSGAFSWGFCILPHRARLGADAPDE